MEIFVYIIFLLTFYLPSGSILNAENTHRVIIKDASFEPGILQINRGDKVEFINASGGERWPASNIHPSHGIYPEFDPKKPVEPKGRWKFQFKNEGNFRYHDHLVPELTGTIMVKKTGVQVFQPKFNLPLHFDGLTPLLLKGYYFIFPEKLKAELAKINSHTLASDKPKLKFWLQVIGGGKFMYELLQDTEGGSKIDCHQEAHLVGRTAYELFKSGVFNKINYGCHSGYLHGAMEAFIKENEGENLIQSVDKLCNEFKTDFSKFECLHGIGHGLMAYQDYDIPKGLELCGGLSNEYARRSCFGGIFMENIMVAEGKGAIAGHKTTWISNDPHFPCNSVDQSELVQYECYQMQTSRMLHIFNYNFQPIVQECLRAPKEMVPVCFKSMGRDIAGQTLRDPKKILERCKAVPQEYFRACIKGALNVIIDFWGEDVTDQPQKLCEILNENEKPSCFGLLGERLKSIFDKDSKKINEICTQVDKEYLKYCLNGATQT